MTDEKDANGSVVEPAETPRLRVLTPDATPEQVAAVVAVFAAMSGGEEEPPAPKSEWSSPARRMRQPLHPGRGGWRASALPR